MSRLLLTMTTDCTLSLSVSLSQFSCDCIRPSCSFVTCSLSLSLPPTPIPTVSDRVQDRGVGDMGLHREQSRGRLPWVPLVLTWGPLSLQCHSFNVIAQTGNYISSKQYSSNLVSVCVFVCVHFLRCLMELSSYSLWPPWWPPQWPTAPAAPGMLSVSSLRCGSGGLKGSLTVRLGGAGVPYILSFTVS